MLKQSVDLFVFLPLLKHIQSLRSFFVVLVLFFSGRERKEKKGVCDGEYDGVADEGDGAVSQYTVQMMDGR